MPPDTPVRSHLPLICEICGKQYDVLATTLQDGLPSFTALISTSHFSRPDLSSFPLLRLFSFGRSPFFSSPSLLLRFLLLSQVRNKTDEEVRNKTEEVRNKAAGAGARASLFEASSHDDGAQTPTAGTIAVGEFTFLTEIQPEGLLHPDTMIPSQREGIP